MCVCARVTERRGESGVDARVWCCSGLFLSLCAEAVRPSERFTAKTKAKRPKHPVAMGKVEGGMKCVKYLLFVFNFIFWVSADKDAFVCK